MKEEKIPRKVLNKRLKGRCPRRKPRSRWEKQVRKDVKWKERRPWEEIEEELWQTEMKGEASLLMR
jgi:hypothetical protein